VKIKLIVLGNTEKGYLTEGCKIFLNRLKHYCDFLFVEISEPKILSKLKPEQRKSEEARLFFEKLENSDKIILLDEKGKEYTSIQFAAYLEKEQLHSTKTICFLVGGPFGFDDSLYQKASGKMALSKLTFSHQMVRLFFLEQLYRAHSIIKGEKYHNE
jgi:23S rRNA (pseudouridine1915-N3)-methyltransferase